MLLDLERDAKYILSWGHLCEVVLVVLRINYYFAFQNEEDFPGDISWGNYGLAIWLVLEKFSGCPEVFSGGWVVLLSGLIIDSWHRIDPLGSLHSCPIKEQKQMANVHRNTRIRLEDVLIAIYGDREVRFEVTEAKGANPPTVAIINISPIIETGPNDRNEQFNKDHIPNYREPIILQCVEISDATVNVHPRPGLLPETITPEIPTGIVVFHNMEVCLRELNLSVEGIFPTGIEASIIPEPGSNPKSVEISTEALREIKGHLDDAIGLVEALPTPRKSNQYPERDQIVSHLRYVREQLNHLENDPSRLRDILQDALKLARNISEEVIRALIIGKIVELLSEFPI